MNVVGGRVLRRIPVGGGTVDLRADVGRLIQRSYVDYTWMGAIDLVARRPLTARLGLLGRAFGETYGVNPKIAGRGAAVRRPARGRGPHLGPRGCAGAVRRLRTDGRRRPPGPAGLATGHSAVFASSTDTIQP